MSSQNKTEKSAGTNKRFVLSFVLLSVGYILLGLFHFLVDDPDGTLLCYLLGGLAIAAGLLRTIVFFAREMRSQLYNNSLTFGITFMVAGVYILLSPETVVALLPVILGFCIVYDSIVKMQYAFGLRYTGYRFWWVFMALAAVTAILGVLLVLGQFSAEVQYYYLGGTLIFDGIANIITLLFLSVMLRKKDKRDAGGPPDAPADTTPETAAEKPAPKDDALITDDEIWDEGSDELH